MTVANNNRSFSEWASEYNYCIGEKFRLKALILETQDSISHVDDTVYLHTHDLKSCRKKRVDLCSKQVEQYESLHCLILKINDLARNILRHPHCDQETDAILGKVMEEHRILLVKLFEKMLFAQDQQILNDFILEDWERSFKKKSACTIL